MNEFNIYVSLKGNDMWSGLYAEALPDGSDGPLQSFNAVKERLKELKNRGRLPEHTNVLLRQGVYRFSEPLIFQPKDSANITIAAYEDEQVTISGGREIKGWKETTVNGKTAWISFLPEVKAERWYFKSLFVNGKRRMRTRYPKNGCLWIEDVPGIPIDSALFNGSNVFQCAEGDIKKWQNLTDAEAVVTHLWVEERMPITGYDEESRFLYSSRRSVFHLKDDLYERYAKYYIENLFEALSEPGEWYLDRKSGMLYYIPMPDEKWEECIVEAPVVTELLVFEGNASSGEYVEDIKISGIKFACTDWEHSKELPQQMAHMRFDPKESYAAAPQAAYNIPAAITLNAARNCSFDRCEFTQMGHYGIEVGKGSRYNRLCRNKFTLCGAGGIRITGGDAFQPVYNQTGYNTIEDNLIKDCGQIFLSSVGIGIFDSYGNSISHNEICYMQYTGISCGWVWGYGESNTHDNTIKGNHIHHLGTGVMSDMGGIYMLGRQPGTLVRGNLIHDIKKANYGGWGLYLDEGSSYITLENNIVYNTSSQCFNIHFGRENVVRNNIFAFGKEGIVGLGRLQDHLQLMFIKNIFITEGTPVFVSTMHNDLDKIKLISECNIFWGKNDNTVLAAKMNWEKQNEGELFRELMDFSDWQKNCRDLHSIITNPGCIDLDEFDFTLPDDSPAKKYGFDVFKADTAGVRK